VTTKSAAQFALLELLAGRPDGATLRTLANRGVTDATLARAVRRGLVGISAQRTSPTVVQFHITAAGRAVIRQRSRRK
jgi:hypothetical protein